MSSQRPQKLGELWIRAEGDETAVFDPATGMLYRLNASALAIWELCDGETDVSEIADAIAELSGLPRSDMLIEVRKTLDQLRELGFVNRP